MKIEICLAVAALLLVGLAACERPADTKQPQRYLKDGVAFHYPGNWEITDDEQLPTHRYIFVESPGSAVFIIQVYRKQDAMPLREFVELMAASAKENTPLADVGQSRFSKDERRVGKTQSIGFGERFQASLLGQKIPHRRVHHAVPGSRHTCYLTAQAADEDWKMVQQGFELIFSTFNEGR